MFWGDILSITFQTVLTKDTQDNVFYRFTVPDFWFTREIFLKVFGHGVPRSISNYTKKGVFDL